MDPAEIAAADIVLTTYSILNREFDGVGKKGEANPPSPLKVRKTPSWPRSWDNFSLL
jgi:hypothetical protein